MDHATPCGFHGKAQLFCSERRIEQDGFALCRTRAQVAFKLGRFAEFGKLREIGARFDGKLTLVDEQFWLASCGDNRKAQR
ncbi:hypothetical protein D9M68_964210 [compost metagenome]